MHIVAKMLRKQARRHFLRYSFPHQPARHQETFLCPSSWQKFRRPIAKKRTFEIGGIFDMNSYPREKDTFSVMTLDA
jgi:hypothetical protein